MAGATAAEVAGCTVSENVAECCSEPEVAVTVTVDVTGCGWTGGGVLVDADEAPLHPDSTTRTTLHSASSAERILRHLFLPRKHTATASAEVGSQGPGLRPRATALDAAFTVSVETILPPATVVEEKLHVTPAGKPEQANTIGEEVGKPFCGVAVIVSAALPPAVTVRVGAETPSAKSAEGAAGTVTVSNAARLGTDPVELETVTLNSAPLSPATAEDVVYEADVAPEIVAPFLYHW